MRSIPVNEPCPCGSGKKYKKCCRDLVRIESLAVFAVERRHPGNLTAMRQAIEAECDSRGIAS